MFVCLGVDTCASATEQNQRKLNNISNLSISFLLMDINTNTRVEIPCFQMATILWTKPIKSKTFQFLVVVGVAVVCVFSSLNKKWKRSRERRKDNRIIVSIWCLCDVKEVKRESKLLNFHSQSTQRERENDLVHASQHHMYARTQGDTHLALGCSSHLLYYMLFSYKWCALGEFSLSNSMLGVCVCVCLCAHNFYEWRRQPERKKVWQKLYTIPIK